MSMGDFRTPRIPIGTCLLYNVYMFLITKVLKFLNNTDLTQDFYYVLYYIVTVSIKRF